MERNQPLYEESLALHRAVYTFGTGGAQAG